MILSQFFDILSWWSMPLSAVGVELISDLAALLTFCATLGISYYIIHRL